MNKSSWYCVVGRRLFDDEDTALNCQAYDADDAVNQLREIVLDKDDDEDSFILNYIFSSDTEIRLELN